MPNARWMIVVLWLLLLCGSRPALLAASSLVVAENSPFTVRPWTPEPGGLPQLSVLAITQSREGYLWLGTANGLARFDGMRFRVFHPANTPGLNDRVIVSLLEDTRGGLWIATENAGVVFVKDGQLQKFDPWSDGLARRIMSFAEDAQGTVWMLTADGQLCQSRNGQGRLVRLESRVAAPRGLFVDEAGVLWITTEAGMISFRTDEMRADGAPVNVQTWDAPRRFKFAFASKSGGHWRLDNGRVQKWKAGQLEREAGPFPWGSKEVRVAAACEDAQGNPIIGTLGDGIYWMDASGGAAHLTRSNGLSYDWILALHMDREENLWVGTDGGGLDRVRRHPFGVLKDTSALVVQSVSEGANGALWMGVNFGDVRRWQDGRLDPFRINVGPEVVAVNLPVRTVMAAEANEIWAGVDLGTGLCRLAGEQFAPYPGPAELRQSVTAMFKDRQGVMWFGTPGGLVRSNGRDWRVFTTRDGLSANSVSALADDAEGNLWIGTRGGGLNQMRQDRFTTFRLGTNGPAGDDIASLLVDQDGVVWAGTSGGLGRFQSGRWTRYSVREGLPSYSVGYLVEDGLGHLWMGSYVGLIRVSKQELNAFAEGKTNSILWRTFGTSDGLPTGECTQGSQPAAYCDRDGRLWFPTVNGLVFVDPRQIKANPHPPQVVIESIVVDGQAQATSAMGSLTTNLVILPPDPERVVLGFTSLNLAAPERTLFRYRLEGYEKGWTEVSERSERSVPSVPYTLLPHGHYEFHVQARNEDGVWNKEGSTLTIIILPPFWQTWWFLMASSLFLLGTMIAAVRTVATRKLRRQVALMQQQEALEKERKRIARDLHDQLGASMTQVSLLGELVESDKDLPEEVEAHGKQISQTARETTRVLDEIVWAVNPSNDTLEGLINYICKSAQDFFEVAGVRFRLEVPPQLPALEIPPEVRHNVFLAAKEAVTNVVRHAKAEAAWMRLKLEPQKFTLEIEDNGRGLAGLDEKRGRNGLRNMRKRMEDVGGEFTISPGANGGAVVRLVVPLGKR